MYDSETGDIQKGYIKFHSTKSSSIMTYLILR